MVGSDATAKSKFIKATTSLHRTVTQAFAQEPDDPRTPFNERERHAAALMGLRSTSRRSPGGQLDSDFSNSDLQ
jgi:hypothetical protein